MHFAADDHDMAFVSSQKSPYFPMSIKGSQRLDFLYLISSAPMMIIATVAPYLLSTA